MLFAIAAVRLKPANGSNIAIFTDLRFFGCEVAGSWVLIEEVGVPPEFKLAAQPDRAIAVDTVALNIAGKRRLRFLARVLWSLIRGVLEGRFAIGTLVDSGVRSGVVVG